MQSLDPRTRIGSTLELHDIRLPPEPGWWPPAPGWWLLLVMIIGLLLLIWLRRRQRLRFGYRNEALQQLRQLEKNAVADDPRLLAELSMLLRRAALCGYPDGRSTTLVGKEWLHFLDAGIGSDAFSNGPGSCLAEGPYEPTCDIDIPGLFAICRRWLRRLPPLREKR
ncbi:MAG: hypothetical protein CSB34_03405 [Desulfobulbus propionicus]|nr:MAG: hypothetical protein CSB34_03405 [Desulfobulbus propionicus]